MGIGASTARPPQRCGGLCFGRKIYFTEKLQVLKKGVYLARDRTKTEQHGQRTEDYPPG